MESLAFYRKYRPQTFQEVVGQDHIVTVLQEFVSLKRIPHALLFSGSRGTGKTSLARIFAHAIQTQDQDLYEIDAASNRGIDDIRMLREAVQTFPFQSPYKVYIIDEVHMLTKEAFNALLKTLEEPPQHVVFVLATTELSKLPETVVSRCQTFSFNRPSREILKKVVAKVAKKEGVVLGRGAAELIALLGDGSFRDTLGVLDKVASLQKQGSEITREEITTLTGAPKTELVETVLEAMVHADIERGLSAIREAGSAGFEMKLFITLLLEKARAILLLSYAPRLKEEVLKDFSKEEQEFMLQLHNDPNRKITKEMIIALLDALENTGRGDIPSLPLELAFLSSVNQKEGNSHSV